MALFVIDSTNPDLGYVLGKNPASGMMVRDIREGKAYGWFSNNNARYNIWFRDSATNVSYKSDQNEDFEYVNNSRFNSAMFPLNALTEFFAATFKKTEEHDKPGFVNTLTINLMYVKNDKYISIFQSYFKDFQMVATQVAPHNYNIVITTERTMRDLMNYVNLFCVFNVLKNESDWFDINDDIVQKYMNALSSVDAPYFVRYVFKVNLMRSPKLFKKYKDVLEKTALYDKIELSLGNSSMGRQNRIKAELGELTNNILDVGCGEGFYALDMSRKQVEGKQYYAVDKDAKLIDHVKWKAERKEIDNLQTFISLDDVPTDDLSEKTDVLLVEVLEHMPVADAEALVEQIFARTNVNRLVITTPNRDFNQFFSDDGDDHMRHEDHHWEMTYQEFLSWIIDLVSKIAVSEGQRTMLGSLGIKALQIGDAVNGIYMTSGVIITRLPEAIPALGAANA